MTTIQPLKLFWNPEVPAVFNDYITYYEQLAFVQTKINEIIAELDGYNEEFLKEANAYTDAQIALLKQYVQQADEALKNDYNDKFEKVNDAINQMNSIIGDLNVSFATLYDEWIHYQGKIDSQFQLMYKNLQQYILDNIATLTNVMVTNPINGKWENINKVLDEMWKASMWAAITAKQFDSLDFTASEFDALLITARDFDYYARLVLFKYVWLRMRSPFTGKLDTYENIINSLAALHMKGITAQEFDNLNEVAQTFDDMDITAYEMDWNGKSILMP